MSELTLGQTVARDLLMTISFWHKLNGGQSLLDSAQTCDERDKVFHQIADEVDEHAQTMRDQLEGEMMQGIATGSLSGTVTLFVDFETAITDALKTVGFDDDTAAILVAHMPRRVPPEAEVVDMTRPK